MRSRIAEAAVALAVVLCVSWTMLVASPAAGVDDANRSQSEASAAATSGGGKGNDRGGTTARESADPRRLFPHRTDVLVDAAGLVRLDLPSKVLTRCRQDLSDLRLFDREGREIAFLIDSLDSPRGAVEAIRRADARIQNVKREESERESAPPLRREGYEIVLPEALFPKAPPSRSTPGSDPSGSAASGSATSGSMPAGGGWDLVLETSVPEFVARVSVDAVGEGGRRSPLVVNGSLFRLTGARRAEKTRLELPPLPGRRFLVTLETEGRAWLQPSFRLEHTRILDRPRPIETPLVIVASSRDDGGSIFELERPRGLVPDRLRLETETGTFDRQVEVRDAGPGGEEIIGSAPLFRIEAPVSVSELEIAVRPARGNRLIVRIADGGSPPLAAPRFTAIVRQPALIFAAPSASDHAGSPAALYFGGGRALPPRYDLARLALRASGRLEGARASAAERLYDPGALPRARLGAIEENPAFDGAPALAFAMRPGAEIDERLFTHRRPLRVPASTDGLTKLALAPADLAVLREDMADLRIVDTQSRQWPYLLEPDAEQAVVDLPVERRAGRDGASLYRLRLPHSPLRISRIVLATDAPFFSRAARLRGRIARSSLPPFASGESSADLELWSGRLERRSGERGAVVLDVAGGPGAGSARPSAPVESLELEIDDGDDAPLEFRSIQGRTPLPEIYIAAPEGEYAVLLGAPSEPAPRYELARIRDVVLAVAPARASAGDLSRNPRSSLPARLASRGGREQAALWIALGAAVIVLLALTLRLARRESGAPS